MFASKHRPVAHEPSGRTEKPRPRRSERCGNVRKLNYCVGFTLSFIAPCLLALWVWLSDWLTQRASLGLCSGQGAKLRPFISRTAPLGQLRLCLVLELSDFQWRRRRRETVKEDDRMTGMRAGGWILKKKEVFILIVTQ